MTQTTGQPEPSQWTTADWSHPTRNPFVADAIAARGYDDYGFGILDDPEPVPEPEPVDDDPQPEPSEDRALTPEAQDARLRAIRETLGDPTYVVEELPAEQHSYAAMDAPPTPLTRPEPPSEGVGEPDTRSRSYVVQEQGWRSQHGLPRKRKTVPPSRTREGRRASHLRKRAAELGITEHEAMYVVQRRQPKRKPS